LPHFTSEYMTMKSPSWSPLAFTKSPTKWKWIHYEK